MPELETQIQQLRDLLNACNRAVVFTGAGISTESGIPDFRSPGGIWSKYQPIYFQDFMESEEARRESWRRKIAVDETLTGSEPNRGHRAVAELVRRGKVASVITQNIDNLHQDSGVPAEQVIELHGNATYAKCLACEKRFELEPLYELFQRDETPPVCDDCSGIIKTATISFGQAMPLREMALAEEQTMQCDLFLVMGSSLVVYPAAGFPLMAKRKGAKFVIINRDSTDQDGEADLVIHEGIGQTLGDAVGVE